MKRRAQSKWVILISTAALFCLLVLIIKLLASDRNSSIVVTPIDSPVGSEDPNASSSPITFELITDDMPDSVDEASFTRRVLFSSPLVVFDRAVATPFRPEEVVVETNRMRVAAGRVPLLYNATLSASAAAKVADMFERQYFDHTTPQGEGPESFVSESGYAYVSIGENLALGNFGDEGGLVDAWMESEGHRANILREQFTEIGVAIGRGTFNGQRVTIAVQHFGKPSSACPSIRTDLRNRISALRAGLAMQSAALDSLKKRIDESSDAERSALVNEYNAAIDAYNRDVADIKSATETYNRSVRSFNECLEA